MESRLCTSNCDFFVQSLKENKGQSSCIFWGWMDTSYTQFETIKPGQDICLHQNYHPNNPHKKELPPYPL